MKNSMLLIFLAVGGVLAYFLLGKKQAPQGGTTTILGSTGNAQPAPVMSKAVNQRANNSRDYAGIAAGLLSSIVSAYSNTKSADAQKHLKQAGLGDDSSVTPGTKSSYTGILNDPLGLFGIGRRPKDQFDAQQYSVSAGPIYSNASQYEEPIGPGLNSNALVNADEASYYDSTYGGDSADYGGEL